MEIWRYIKEHDNGITNFHFEVAADVLKDDEIELISDTVRDWRSVNEHRYDH